MKKAYLYLENGQTLEGQSFGASGTVMGELVFTTGMIGCAEALTDPTYYGQLVIFTFPQLGNCGVCHEDMESPRCRMQGVVVREFCEDPSNFRCDESVDAFLKAQNVVGIAGIDTRFLTQLIRDGGTLNAVISTQDTAPDWESIRAYRIQDAVKNTAEAISETLPGKGDETFSVALLDYGSTKNIKESLIARGCRVTVYPYATPAETILQGNHDGLVCSNGPGDPTENTFCIDQLSTLLGKLPMFGIALGHEMMALAAGAKTAKLKFGHHGANQPVKNLETGEVTITTQNHSYAVTLDSLEHTKGTPSFVNVNDGTCEGIDYPEHHAFSLQFNPEAHGVPRNPQTAFDRFMNMMKEGL